MIDILLSRFLPGKYDNFGRAKPVEYTTGQVSYTREIFLIFEETNLRFSVKQYVL